MLFSKNNFSQVLYWLWLWIIGTLLFARAGKFAFRLQYCEISEITYPYVRVYTCKIHSAPVQKFAFIPVSLDVKFP